MGLTSAAFGVLCLCAQDVPQLSVRLTLLAEHAPTQSQSTPLRLQKIRCPAPELTVAASLQSIRDCNQSAGSCIGLSFGCVRQSQHTHCTPKVTQTWCWRQHIRRLRASHPLSPRQASISHAPKAVDLSCSGSVALTENHKVSYATPMISGREQLGLKHITPREYAPSYCDLL